MKQVVTLLLIMCSIVGGLLLNAYLMGVWNIYPTSWMPYALGVWFVWFAIIVYRDYKRNNNPPA